MLFAFRYEDHDTFHRHQYFSRWNVVQKKLKLQNKGKVCNRFPGYKLEILDQKDLTDIYRTFHPTPAEHAVLSNTQRTSFRIDNMVGHKTSLNKFKKIKKSHQVYFPRIKLEINNSRKTGNFTNMWKLNKILMNNQ